MELIIKQLMFPVLICGDKTNFLRLNVLGARTINDTYILRVSLLIHPVIVDISFVFRP
jgi:hypothetical protein